MEKVNKKDFIGRLGLIPQTCGVFTLFRGEIPLFVKSSENLQRFVYIYCDESSNDKNVADLASQVDSIHFIEHPSLIQAYIDEIEFIDKYQPAFNNIIKAWFYYVYLGVNFERIPYLKACQTTLEEDIYIGPFRSEFTLNDVLDCFAEVYQIDKYAEALPDMLNRLALVPNQEAVKKLETKYETLMNELEFNKAEALATQISLFKRYYKNLLFCYTSQFIDGDFKVNDSTLFIKEGMITEIVSKNSYISMKQSDLSYRRHNELLAYDKSEYDHRWIVWNFLYQTQPKMIEDLFLENLVDLQERLFKGLNI